MGTLKASKADIMALLPSLRRGQFIEIIDEQLSELTAAVFATDGDGELTITLKLKSNQEGQVTITPRVKSKKPTRQAGDAIFHATVDGGLMRDDPRQARMFEDEGGGRGSN